MGELAGSTEYITSMGFVVRLTVRLIKIPLYITCATLGTVKGVYLGLTFTVRSCPRSRRNGNIEHHGACRRDWTLNDIVVSLTPGFSVHESSPARPDAEEKASILKAWE